MPVLAKAAAKSASLRKSLSLFVVGVRCKRVCAYMCVSNCSAIDTATAAKESVPFHAKHNSYHAPIDESRKRCNDRRLREGGNQRAQPAGLPLRPSSPQHGQRVRDAAPSGVEQGGADVSEDDGYCWKDGKSAGEKGER